MIKSESPPLITVTMIILEDRIGISTGCESQSGSTILSSTASLQNRQLEWPGTGKWILILYCFIFLPLSDVNAGKTNAYERPCDGRKPTRYASSLLQVDLLLPPEVLESG